MELCQSCCCLDRASGLQCRRGLAGLAEHMTPMLGLACHNGATHRQTLLAHACSACSAGASAERLQLRLGMLALYCQDARTISFAARSLARRTGSRSAAFVRPALSLLLLVRERPATWWHKPGQEQTGRIQLSTAAGGMQDANRVDRSSKFLQLPQHSSPASSKQMQGLLSARAENKHANR